MFLSAHRQSHGIEIHITNRQVLQISTGCFAKGRGSQGYVSAANRYIALFTRLLDLMLSQPTLKTCEDDAMTPGRNRLSAEMCDRIWLISLMLKWHIPIFRVSMVRGSWNVILETLYWFSLGPIAWLIIPNKILQHSQWSICSTSIIVLESLQHKIEIVHAVTNWCHRKMMYESLNWIS